MPNILIIQEAGRHEANKNFRECLSLQRAFKHHGIDAHVWGLGHENYYQMPFFNDYDLIINLENYDTTGWVPDLSFVKSKKFLWAIDAHVKGIQSYLNTASNGGYHLILQASPIFVKFGASAWFPNCYDDELITPKDLVPGSETYNVGFCGNVCNRGKLIDTMKTECDLHFDEFVIGDNMVNAINSYKIHWNCNISADINYRNFETMGCKTLLLTSRHNGYEQLGIKHEENCLVYSNTEEMISLPLHILEHDDLRLQMAEAGYELVKQKHTYKNRAQQILEIFDALN